MDERSWTAVKKSPSESAFPSDIEAVWSCIGLARGYPLLRVDGYDLDPASVELARHNVAAAGLADRVHVYQTDITTAADCYPTA